MACYNRQPRFITSGGGRPSPVSRREEMLARIRKALGCPDQGSRETPLGGISTPMGAVMPPLEPESWLPKFEAEWGKVGGSAYRAKTPAELEDIIRGILQTSQASSVVLSRNPLLGQLDLEKRFRAWGTSVEVWPDLGPATPGGESTQFRHSCLSASVGITGVDFALAETGSLVLTSRSEGSQLTSLAPPVHVALYRRSQVIGSLEEVLEKLPVSRNLSVPNPGRSVVFVTGPSRTADIEQILVRGVHGPREEHAILVEESCLV